MFPIFFFFISFLGNLFRGSPFFQGKSTEKLNLTGSVYYHLREHFWYLFFEDYAHHMLSATSSQMIQPLSPIINDSFEHHN